MKKNEALMNIIGLKEESLVKELKEKHEENMKEMEAQYAFEITHLKEEL